jgi:methionyl-tRNA synthetase
VEARRYLVTAGLPYSNGRLHVGHIAGAYLPADIWVRYRRARGDEVRFVCGSDDNGVASLLSAEREGKSVEELTAHYHARQLADFRGLGIEFDVFGGTHQPGYVARHVEVSQAFFRRIHERGYFAKRETEQLYDPVRGRFLPDRYVRGTCYHVRADGTPCRYPQAYGDQCESCGNSIDPLQLIDPVSVLSGTRPVPRRTTHWFLKLREFEQPLREWLESKRVAREGEPAWRDAVLNFVLGQVQSGLPERAMTRDLEWGVPVPLDDPEAAGKVLYVWFDAPIGYVSFTAAMCERDEGDWRRYERWWKEPSTRIVHFIGEDNTVFHALIWPAMLMAEGSFELPWQVVANAFLNIKFPGKEEEKISKSRGTAIWIEDYLRAFDPDPLRYYLTAIAPETHRTTFDAGEFVARANGELLNALGNFIHRSLTFAQRYHEGRVPPVGDRGAADREQLARLAAHAARAAELLDGFRFRAALGEVMGLARASNGYLDVKQPWRQRKEDPAGCGTTINVCLQTVRTLTTLMAPFLPFSSARAAAMAGIAPELPWGAATDELEPGHRLGEPEILFRKIEPEEVEGASGN